MADPSKLKPLLDFFGIDPSDSKYEEKLRAAVLENTEGYVCAIISRKDEMVTFFATNTPDVTPRSLLFSDLNDQSIPTTLDVIEDEARKLAHTMSGVTATPSQESKTTSKNPTSSYRAEDGTLWHRSMSSLDDNGTVTLYSTDKNVDECHHSRLLYLLKVIRQEQSAQQVHMDAYVSPCIGGIRIAGFSIINKNGSEAIYSRHNSISFGAILAAEIALDNINTLSYKDSRDACKKLFDQLEMSDD